MFFPSRHLSTCALLRVGFGVDARGLPVLSSPVSLACFVSPFICVFFALVCTILRSSFNPLTGLVVVLVFFFNRLPDMRYFPFFLSVGTFFFLSPGTFFSSSPPGTFFSSPHRRRVLSFLLIAAGCFLFFLSPGTYFFASRVFSRFCRRPWIYPPTLKSRSRGRPRTQIGPGTAAHSPRLGPSWNTPPHEQGSGLPSLPGPLVLRCECR